MTSHLLLQETDTHRESHNVAVLFEANGVLILKRDYIPRVINQGPFFVGTVEADISDEEQNTFYDVQLFVLSFEDCVLFTFYSKERIHRDSIAGKVDEGHFKRGDNFVKLTEMSYEAFLRHQNDVEDLLPDKESCEESSDLDSEDESQADVVFGGIPLRTSSGRNVVRPDRLDL